MRGLTAPLNLPKAKQKVPNAKMNKCLTNVKLTVLHAVYFNGQKIAIFIPIAA
jgi:hypothetical protein